jgi:PKD domain/MBG domain
VTLDGVPFDNASVAIQGGVTLDSDLYLFGGSLIFDDSAPLTLGAGPLVPSVTIYLSGGNLFNQSSQPVTLSSDVTLSGNYSNSIGGVDTDVYPQLSYYGPFINQGTIEQDGGELTIDAATWVNDGTIAATGATLNLYGSWTNNGTITADSASTVSLGTAVAINPTSAAAAGYSWTNDGTITISAGATVYLGGVFTTDEYAGNFADRGVTLDLAGDTVYLTGTMDNSAADNPVTQGTLALSPSTGPLYLSGGEIYQGQVTSDGSDNLVATYLGGTLDGVTIDGTPEQLTLSVLHGTLTLETTTNLTVTGNGTASLVVSGSLASLNSDLPSLTYTPTPGYSGPDTLSLSDKDAADSLTGAASVSITVNPSPAPTIAAPVSVAFTENGIVFFTGGDAIIVSDPSAAGPEQLTLSVLDGTLSVETTTGLTVTGNGSATLTLVGSVGDVDFGLASLTYVPNYGYDGPDTLSLSDTDTGNSLTGTASVAITVNSLVPTITGTTVSVAENGTLAFTGGNAIGVADASATLNMSQGSANVTLVGGTLDSALDISGGGASATILGGLTLNADVYLSGDSTFLYFNDPNPQAVSVGTLATGATIHLDGTSAGIDNESTQTLTFELGVTIAADSAQPTYYNQDPSNTINGPIDNEGTIEEDNLEENLGNTSALIINLDQYDEYGLVRWTNGPTGTIEVASDGRLQLGGAWTNYGTITAADSVINSFTGDILGTELQLGDDLNAGPYDFHQFNSNVFVDNGTITSDAWQNFGTITTNDVNVYLGGWLSLDPSANNIATLDLSDNAVYLNGTLDNSPKDNPYTNGVLALMPGVTSSTGTWNLNGGRIYEGTITTSGGAFLNSVGLTPPFNDDAYDGLSSVSGVLDGVTLDGTVNMSVAGADGNYSFSGLTIVNNLVLNSILDLNNGSTLYFVHAVNSGPFGQTLSGSGSIVFQTGGTIDINNSVDSSTDAYGYDPAGFPLVIGPGITIVGPGSGAPGTINGPIDNQGTIEETAGGTLAINFDEYIPVYESLYPLVSWTNDTTGVIQVTSGTLEIGGAWTNKGTIAAADGTNIYLGDNWDFWDGFFGYDYFGTNDAWVNNGTITTNSANVYLGGWLSYNPGTDNLATLDLSENTVYLIGTLDNSPADNPSSGGVLTLTPGVTSSTGSWYLDGGRIYEGTIDATAASLIATATEFQYVDDEVGEVLDGGGTLYGVTLDGTLDMSGEIVSVIIADGLTLDNDLNVSGLGAKLYVDVSHSQAVGVGALVGSATIHLSGYGAEIVTTSDSSQPPSRSIATFDPTITISGEASLNYILGGGVGDADLDNQGTIEDNTSGGVLDTDYDVFVNWSGGNFGTLTGGTWKVSNGGILVFDEENITTNAATISLSGANSHLESYDFGYSDYTDALAGLMTNTSIGNLYLADGYVFSTPVFVENDGNIVVTSGASATLAGTAWDNSASGLISATDATLNLFGSWTNFGAVTADASTVSLGNPVDISPTDPSAPGYDWSSPGTIVFSGDCAVDLGGVFTTDTFDTLVSDQLAAGQSLADDTVNLTGTIDNSAADNPVSDGVLALSTSTGPLYLSGGEVYQGELTTDGIDDLVATDLGGVLDGVTIDGTLDMSQGSANVALAAATLDDVLNISGGGASATILGGLTLNADVDLSGGSTFLDFNDPNPQTVSVGTLASSATIHLSGSGSGIDNESSQSVTLGPSIAIQAGLLSYLESPNAAIDNQGTVEESTSGGTLNVTSPDGFSNAGSLIVGSGATISFGAANYTQSAGTTTVDGTLIAANVYLDGGSLNGTGTVQSNVTNGGAVAPGDTSGTLTVQGNYVQNSAGALDVVLGALSNYSQLAISGRATLAGTLNVSLQNGFTPDPSDSFPILTYASESGGFTSEPSLNVGNGTSLTPVYSSGILTFTVGQESPSITVSTNTLALGTTSQGTAGPPQSFTVSGSDLTADILLTAPSGVQLSDNGGTSYSATLDLAESAGTVTTTTVWAIIDDTAPAGLLSGVIAADSTGATEQDVSVSGTVEAPTQLTLTVVATDAGGTYNGNSFPASATASGAGGIAVNGSFAFTYYVGGTASGQGSSTAPTTAGTYTVQAAFTSSNPNYDNADSAPVTFTIGQASPVVTLTDAGGVFDGNSYAATGTIAGVVAGVDNTPAGSLESVPLVLSYYVGTNMTGTPLSSAPSTTGSYIVVASFAGSPDYVSTADQVTFAISPATPSVIASDAGGTYNGNPLPASASTTGVGGTAVSGSFTFDYYVGSTASGAAAGTAPTSAGTYTVVAAFTSTNSNYATGPTDSAPVTFAISPAVPTVTATDVGGTYNGSSFPASGTATGVGGAMVSGSFAFSYYVGSTATGTPTSTAPSNAGTYTVVAAFTSNNSNYVTGPTDSAPVTLTIGQATPAVVATDAGGPYNGNSFPASGTATGVGGATISGSFAFSYFVGGTATGTPTSTAPTNAGTYTVVAAFTSSNANYVTGPSNSAPVTFTIGQVTPKVVAADAGGTYNGNPFSASATATGVGGATVSGSLTFAYYVGSTASGTASTTAPTNAGTYTVVAAFTSTNSNYVTGPTGSGPVTFTIGQATPTVVATDAGGTYNGNPFPATASATGVGGAAVSGTFAFTYYVGTTASGTGTSTAPASVGTYTVVAAFTSTNSNYVTGSTDSAPVTFTISSAAPSVHLGLLLLDPSGSGALDLTGSGAITVNDGGALVVDSNSSTAAVITGSGKVSASPIDVTGGTKVTGSGKFSSTVQHPAALADPLGLSLPAAPSTTFAAVNDTGSARLTLSPGTYVGGIKIAGSGAVTLLPGVYYMEGGGFSITGSAMVAGAGILLINAPNKSTDTISLTGSGSLCLTPSNILSGAYASYDGITILQNPASTNPINVTGSGVLNITGILYAPKATVNIAGSGGLLVNPDAIYGRAEVVVSDLNDAGSGFVTIDVDAPAATVGTPIPTSVPGESVPLVIKVCDPSSLAQGATFTFAISFGDGDIKTLTGPSSLIVNHVYTQTGTYLVTVTVTDEFGNTSAPVTQTIKVVPVAVETDPSNSSLTALFIGTSGNETVTLTASGSNRLSATPNGGSGIAVTLNGVSEGVYSTSGPVVVFEQGGSDTVSESGVTNSVDLIESLTTDNIEADLDNEAIQWAGLTAAVEILNA